MNSWNSRTPEQSASPAGPAVGIDAAALEGDLERQVELQALELAALRLEVIHNLCRAAECRDNDMGTGRHVVRVGRYAGIITRRLGLSEVIAEQIERAAPLHDVGKIGIPDKILLKRGKLTRDEMEIVRRHCELGARIIREMSINPRRGLGGHAASTGLPNADDLPTLEMAARIAMTHHERWDGSGYPCGLRGEEIPLEGRITAVADVFDALSHKRPYKPAFPLEECFRMMEEGRGGHFDSQVLDAFFARRAEILRVRQECAEMARTIVLYDLPLTPEATPAL